MFTYKALVTRVVDGDTIDVSIDLGFDIWHTTRLRLNGIDTPEMNTQAGKDVKAWLAAAIEQRVVTITTYKPDKYGRYLADVFDVTGVNLNLAMIDSGMALPYTGGKRP